MQLTNTYSLNSKKVARGNTQRFLKNNYFLAHLVLKSYATETFFI